MKNQLPEDGNYFSIANYKTMVFYVERDLQIYHTCTHTLSTNTIIIYVGTLFLKS